VQAVILAAGLGTRISSLTKDQLPKGLLKSAGREILYRTLTYLKKNGINEFIVVVNPKYQKKYEEFFKKYSFSVKFVLNSSPERGNGYSLFLAKELVREKFVLVMSDHLYEEAFVREAIRGEGLIVDAQGKYIDPEEATKVKIEQNRVVDIGKSIKDYHGFDTGFFVLSPEIFKTAEELVSSKRVVELSEIVKKAGLKVSFVNGYFWMDVDTPQDLTKARKFLVKTSVKGAGDGLISRLINRMISTWVSSYLVDKISPNQATFFTFLLGILSSLVALINVPLGGVLYQISSILDGIDGEIARASLRTSKWGGYLDSVLDRYVDFAFLLALMWKSAPPLSFFPIVCMAMFGSVMVSYSTERYKAAFGEDIYVKIPAMKYLIGKRDERVFLIMLFCLCNRIFELFSVLAVLTNLRVVLTLIFAWRAQKSLT